MPSIKTSFATVSLFVLFVFACVAYVANAQELTPQERFEALKAETEANRAAREEMRTERRENMASSSEARQELREERRTALTLRAQQRITNLAANISNRMEAAIARMAQIADRLAARIDELEAAGVDTAAAEGHLADAKAALDRAQAAIADIDTEMAAVTGSESPKEAWQAARGTYASVKEELLAGHQALRATVAALKDAVKAAGLEAGASSAVSERAGAADQAPAEAAE